MNCYYVYNNVPLKKQLLMNWHQSFEVLIIVNWFSNEITNT